MDKISLSKEMETLFTPYLGSLRKVRRNTLIIDKKTSENYRAT
jgi:hypothetical protein